MRYLIALNRTIRGKLPKDATPGQWAAFNDAFENVELTAGEIAREIQEGYSIAPQHDGRRKATNWRLAQHIGIDLDDGTLSWDELIARPLVANHAAIIHTTASHRPEHPRYRVLFLLDEPYRDAGGYAYLVGCMLRVFETADTSCKDPSRFFFGAPGCSLLLQPCNVLTSEDLANLATAYPAPDDHDLQDDTRPRATPPKVPPAAHHCPAGDHDGAIVLPGDISAARLDAHSEALLDNIRTAPDGTKWETLRDISRTLGGYVETGYYQRGEIESRLRRAIEARRSTVASMEAAYKTISEGLDYGALSPLFYHAKTGAATPASEATPAAILARIEATRQDLAAMREERIKELEAAIIAADMHSDDIAPLAEEYALLMAASQNTNLREPALS